MTFQKQEQITKKSDDLLTELSNYHGENLISEIVHLGIQNLMELERDEHIGVGSYERGAERCSQRNGYKSRTLYTRVGSLLLQVPQTRDGQFYPSILERYQRSEKALVLALSEAYLQGVSTRKMKLVTEQLMGKEFSSASISRFSAQLDAELDAWRERSFTKDYPYVFVDARYESCRVDGKIIDIACLIAIGIDSEGYRHVLGMDTAWSETGDSWDRFIGGLKERGLKGVRLFTSDDHPGIHPAIKKYYPGAVWQRCQRHFSVNATDLVPKSRRDEVYQRLKEAWDCKEYEDAQAKMDQLAEDYQDKYPALSELLSEHAWETLGVYLVAPHEHHKRLRTTNMLERVNQELKRRSKVVRIFPNPKSCLRLFTALLKEWHEDWAYGKIYLRMDMLEEFESRKKAQQQERAPVVEERSIEKEKITVA
ncbi:MAG: IS256 family transposase [Bacteroidota bacterium]|nr:IS256 family transposase [Bacteroidota bacterium]